MSKTNAQQSATVSVGAASVAIAGVNSGRSEITIVNDHATQIVYLALQTSGTAPTAVLNSGVRLNAAGGSYTTTFKGAIAAIATGAATGVTVVEW